MYFPPFPALLRLPVLFTTDEFDGRLTLLSMALAFVLMAVMTTKLVWLVRDLMRPRRPAAVTRLEAVVDGRCFLALGHGRHDADLRRVAARGSTTRSTRGPIPLVRRLDVLDAAGAAAIPTAPRIGWLVAFAWPRS